MISQVFGGVVFCRLSQYIFNFEPKNEPQYIFGTKSQEQASPLS